MKAFMEEYGRILVSALVVLVLVASAKGLGSNIQGGIQAAVTGFTDKMETVTDKIKTNGSGEVGSGSADLDLSTVNTDLATNTWEDVQKVIKAGKAAEAGWQVGDTKTLTINGQEKEATIIGLDHDGENTATFMVMSNIGSHSVNSTYTNTGGWEASEMRTWLNSDIYESMSNKDQIKEVTKMTDNVGGSGQEISVSTTSDKVFLLSVIEAGLQDQAENDFGYSYMDAINGEGATYEWFNTNSLDDDLFRLRSPISFNDYGFFGYFGGGLDSFDANIEIPVFPAFVIG